MTVLQICLGIVFLFSTTATLAYMWALYQLGIFNLAGLNPQNPRVGPATEFVGFHGGPERVERCSKNGIEIFAPLTLVSFIVLVMSFYFRTPPPLP